LQYAQEIWVVVCVSILLAFVLEPAVRLLEKIRVPRSLGAIIAMLVLFAALYGISAIFYNRAVEFSHDLPRYASEARHYISKYTQEAQRIANTARAAIPEQNPPRTIRVTQQSSLWDALGSSLGTATEIAFSVSFIPFLAYFMLSWKEHARRSTVLLFPPEARHAAYETLGNITEMIRGFIVGNLLVGLFIGALSTAAFGLLGIPYFYFVGFISGFLSLVPYLGVLLALVPPILAGLGIIHGSAFLFIVLTVFGLHLFSLNVLYPKFLGKRVQLNPLAVTLALLFWGWIWGAMGLILAIPMTAAMKIAFDHVDSLAPLGAWLGE
jgi:predicted PurR-regulated permease PerM